jgi:hypothetical protein
MNAFALEDASTPEAVIALDKKVKDVARNRLERTQ